MDRDVRTCVHYKGHQWSPWRIIEAWDRNGKPLAIGGRPEAVGAWSVYQRVVIRRICFACFDYEHKRMESK